MISQGSFYLVTFQGEGEEEVDTAHVFTQQLSKIESAIGQIVDYDFEITGIDLIGKGVAYV